MHLTRLTNGGFPTPRLQVARNAVGVLKVTDIR